MTEVVKFPRDHAAPPAADRARRAIERLLSPRLFAPVEFAEIGSMQLRQLAPYGIKADEIADCVERSAGFALPSCARGDGVTLEEIIATVARGKSNTEGCEAPGCKAPATRTVYGKRCCDDDTHRAELPPHLAGFRR